MKIFYLEIYIVYSSTNPTQNYMMNFDKCLANILAAPLFFVNTEFGKATKFKNLDQMTGILMDFFQDIEK